MMDWLWSLLGYEAELRPPSVNVAVVRIPADKKPAHIITLATTPVSSGPDNFLFHIPDLRPFWKTERAWSFRDCQRLALEQQPKPSCNGVYYIFYSFGLDELTEKINPSVPTYFSGGQVLWGDVFVVKVAPHEYGEHGWAAYEDIGPEFLELMARWPVTRRF
ncbi:hypothetical protein DRE_06767 [Drechslerella stenobrocha 248]|uniref:Uncharacterized protein n=1 Tax=Drechslerella stenobrocha 248 TaxID=1043628 RepID=W7HN25_9PEZI|nr:hypothetical protein DRE_06767 [Drechslerella stenobrocha 248]